MVVRIKSTTALLKTLADSVGGISTAACDQQQASSGNYICDRYLRIIHVLPIRLYI